MKKSNNIEFIKKAKEIHNNNYDYSLVDYKNANTKVKIICKKHNIFEQTPYKHLKGQGCPICHGKNKLSTLDFIKKAKEIHGDKYDYSKSIYSNINNKITIICKKHGDFNQIAGTHIYNKSGCPKCSDAEKSTTDNFIKKSKEIHGDKYDYSSVKYNTNYKKVKIICKKHGMFEQQPNKHLNGQGCPICADNIRLNNLKFIERANQIHHNKYDYSLVEYKNNKTKIKIICKKHGIFEQSPTNHLSKKQNCPLCKIKSKGEKEIIRILSHYNIAFEPQKKFEECRNIFKLPFDFYLPEYNIIIEFDGRQHLNINTKYYTDQLIINDNIKTKFCIENNINLLRMKYNDNIEEKIINYMKKFENFISEDASATMGNSNGMGAVVSAQPSVTPGSVNSIDATPGSGDIGQPLGGAFMKSAPNLRKRKDGKYKMKKIQSYDNFKP